jgi:hypothetical protein
VLPSSMSGSTKIVGPDGGHSYILDYESKAACRAAVSRRLDALFVVWRAVRAAPQAAWAGGLWLWRTRPWGLVAVVVPSGWKVSLQPRWWTAMRW